TRTVARGVVLVGEESKHVLASLRFGSVPAGDGGKITDMPIVSTESSKSVKLQRHGTETDEYLGVATIF
ncbi:MAG: hypothetical protein ACRCZF_26955, partial [Gemmataceae bacterium]